MTTVDDNKELHLACGQHTTKGHPPIEGAITDAGADRRVSYIGILLYWDIAAFHCAPAQVVKGVVDKWVPAKSCEIVYPHCLRALSGRTLPASVNDPPCLFGYWVTPRVLALRSIMGTPRLGPEKADLFGRKADVETF